MMKPALLLPVRLAGCWRCCCRLDLWWRPLPVLLIPVTAVLVREGHNWVLIDAGAPDSWSQAYASRLVQAVQKRLSSRDKLQAILRECVRVYIGVCVFVL